MKPRLHHVAGPRAGLLLVAFVAVGLLLPLASRADAGPKPSMSFTFAFQGEPVAIVEGQMLECEDAECTRSKPLPQLGPQGFRCTSGACSSTAYGYAPYHKLVIRFADGTRESNVFGKRAFAARYRVTVSGSALEVKEVYGPLDLCCPVNLCLGSSLVTILLETLVAGAYLGAFRLPRAFLGWVPLASLFTLPVVWLLAPQAGAHAGLAIGVAEAFAVLFEGGLVYVMGRRAAPLKHILVMSLAMNAASFAAGLLL